MVVKPNSLRSKFIIFVVIIITPIATSSIVSLMISKRINDHYNFMMNKMSRTNQIKTYLTNSFNNFNKYIQTNTIQSKNIYEESYSEAIESLNYLKENSDLQSRYILRDVENSLRSYKTSADDTIRIYDKQSAIDAYYGGYVNTKEIASYCNTFISKLSDSYLSYNNEVYNKLKEKETFIYKVLVTYIAFALLISILYTLIFLKNILNKLRELVHNSEKVSNGDFTYYEGQKTNIYELDILSEAFRTMISNIKKHINSLKETAELEKKIRDDEMKLLKYENALKLSQLKVLQSQINPHFLFNTLNCINQTAIKEKALATESLIKSVSGILRYSLSMMNRNATLDEEINITKQYMFIQQLRYEERIKFTLNINADLTKLKVPGMTLQPFVENAFIHGIEPKEEGGEIKINIYEKDNIYFVSIEDDGCGIDEETLYKIISEDSNKEHIGHTTGMGIRSVIERLELMYDEKNMFEITSKKGIGTKIYLKIPMKELSVYAKASSS
ncbi:sensor histidine kinase [Clostridium swellfunianum]|uniref:sensor histidine kinase n=1 Tax=Clostridium swellfunianum TaxID=1367462 RepID=UPI0020300D23|nr:sensor histidine kinase [Clostridium swellfunianum]MCM0649624.1 sensor histidine kinase [Clostridium swellfunianum]